jgi:hypothetical protein
MRIEIRNSALQVSVYDTKLARLCKQGQRAAAIHFHHEDARSAPKCVGRTGLYKTILPIDSRLFLWRAAFCSIQDQAKSLPMAWRFVNFLIIEIF